MSDLISKRFIQEALIERISNLNAEGEKSIQTARELIRFKRFVDGLTPSADRPTGEWVVHPLASKSEEFADWYVCTACGIGCKRREHGLNNGIPWETVYNYPYCPNCGAKMFRKDGE